MKITVFLFASVIAAQIWLIVWLRSHDISIPEPVARARSVAANAYSHKTQRELARGQGEVNRHVPPRPAAHGVDTETAREHVPANDEEQHGTGFERQLNVKKVAYRQFADDPSSAEVTVVVMWRETVSMTLEVLREVLEDETIPVEVLYVHLDMPYYKYILDRVRALQGEHANLRIITVNQWMMRYELYELILPTVRTRFFMSHDNNNILVPEGWLQLLVRAMRVRDDGPIMIAPEIQAINKRNTVNMQDHHAMMMIGQTQPEPGSNATNNVMWWAGTHDATVIAELDGAYKLVVGDMIELHSFMIDLKYLNPADYGKLAEYSTWPTYHFELGLHMWRTYGHGAVGVLEGLEYAYNLPRSHMVLSDVPMSMMAWNAWDALWTESYVEEKYGCLYHHEGGYDWHMRMAFHDSSWIAEDVQHGVLSDDPVLIASLLLSLYGVHHVTHGTVSASVLPYELADPAGPALSHGSAVKLNARADKQRKTLRSLLTWIGEQSETIRSLWEETSIGMFLGGIQRRVAKDHNQSLGRLQDVDETRKWFKDAVRASNSSNVNTSLKFVKEMMKPENQANRLNWTLKRRGFLWITGSFGDEVHEKLVRTSSVVMRTTGDGAADYFHYVIIILTANEQLSEFGASLELLRGRSDVPFSVQQYFIMEDGEIGHMAYPEGHDRTPLLPVLLPKRTVLVKWGKRADRQELFRISNQGGPIKSWKKLQSSLFGDADQ